MTPMGIGWKVFVFCFLCLTASHAAGPEPVPPYIPKVQGPLTNFEIVGSGVMRTMLNRLTQKFKALHPSLTIGLQSPSSEGIPEALIQGTITVGAMSRPLDMPETLVGLDRFSHLIQGYQIAGDALEIIVNPANPLTGLTLQQLDGIYSSMRLRGSPPLATWDDLGLGGSWQGQPIVAWGGGQGWGTTMSFESMVTHGMASKDDIKVACIESGIPSEVARDRNAIGYTTVGRDKDEDSVVKVLPLQVTAGSPFIPCTPATVADGSYPLRRGLYLYIAPDADGHIPPAVEEFLRFVYSKEGQEAVAQSGMFPLSAEQDLKERTKLDTGMPLD